MVDLMKNMKIYIFFSFKKVFILYNNARSTRETWFQINVYKAEQLLKEKTPSECESRRVERPAKLQHARSPHLSLSSHGARVSGSASPRGPRGPLTSYFPDSYTPHKSQPHSCQQHVTTNLSIQKLLKTLLTIT